MNKKTRPTFSPEFRLECALLVLSQGYFVAKAAQAMNVSKSTMNKSVQQLRKECAGVIPKATTMTPDQLRISELEKRMKQVELEKETLKKYRQLRWQAGKFRTVTDCQNLCML